MCMNKSINEYKRILIIGESGRGKSVLAHKLSEKLSLPFYSTDDFFWKIKFSEPNDKEESKVKIREVYATEKWIMEGSSTHLFRLGLDSAEVVINLVFGNIFQQWWSLIQRNRTREYESLRDLSKFIIYVTKKRFGIGNDKEKLKAELLKPYSNKIIVLKSFKEIDSFLNSIH
jgi:adenylate kinase family enzyme